jgi:hypothetical protein
MFRNLRIRSLVIIFLSLLLCVAILQVFMFITNRSIYIHFGLSFIALFIALLLFHSVNIKLKSRKKK